ncbi:MAG: MFS transporter [Betaproteobacteria bacterium]
MSSLPIFLVSITWNYGLGMTYVVVPLYAASQGLSGVEIGLLFSMPVFVQVVFNLIGGAYTDRIGGRKIMLGSSLLLALGAVEFIFARGFWMLFAGQVLFVLARAAFWPATWALASELPGPRSQQMGRLNALTNIGQIAGTVSAGFILAAAGFTASFLTLAAMGFVSLLAGLPAQQLPRKETEAGRSLFANYAALLRRPVIWYTVSCAYLSALPFSLSMSFYPLLFKDYGYDSEASGVLIAVRAVGSIGAGLAAARFVRTGAASLSPIIAGVSVALAVGLTPALNDAFFIGFLMMVVGLGSGIMTLYFQITMSDYTAQAERGSALALGGLGWGFSHLTTPLAMGYLADHIGLAAGFYVLGGFAMLWTLSLAVMRPWAFAQPKPTT